MSRGTPLLSVFAETPYFTLVKEGGGAPLLHPCTRNLFPIPEDLNFWLKQILKQILKQENASHN